MKSFPTLLIITPSRHRSLSGRILFVLLLKTGFLCVAAPLSLNSETRPLGLKAWDTTPSFCGHKLVWCVQHPGAAPIHTVLSAAGLIDGGRNRHRSDSRNARIFSVSFSAPCIFRREVFQNFPVKNRTVLTTTPSQPHKKKTLDTLSLHSLKL